MRNDEFNTNSMCRVMKLFRYVDMRTNRRRDDTSNRSVENGTALDFECKIRPSFIHHLK